MHPAAGYLLDKVFPGLLGTGVGAWLAFWSKRRMDRSEEIKKQKAAANYALFVLIQQTNELLLIEKNLTKFRLETARDTRWMEIQPLIHFLEAPSLSTGELAWLLQKADPNLLPKLVVARNKFLTVRGFLEVRREIKTRVAQHLESRTEGVVSPGGDLPVEFVMAHLTGRQRIELDLSAEQLLDLNLDALHFHFEIVEELYSALKSIWPRKRDKFIRPEAKGILLRRLGLTLPDRQPQPSQESAQPGS